MHIDTVLTSLSGTYPLWWIAQIGALVIVVALILRWRPKFLKGNTIGGSLGKTLDAREAEIRVQLAAAQRSREEAARIREQSAADVEQARQEANDIVARATQTSQTIQHEIEVRAHDEYQRVVGQARNEIEYERQQAESRLRREAADIVIDAARQVIDRHLQETTDRRLIEDSLASMKDGR